MRGLRGMVTALLVVLLGTGCASMPGSRSRSAQTSAGDGRASHSTRDVLLWDEIERESVMSLHQAIERLRPHFLHSRGRTSIMNQRSMLPMVVANGIELGTVEVLRTIPAHDVAAVRLLNAADATTRYGTGYMSGVIEIVFKQ